MGRSKVMSFGINPELKLKMEQICEEMGMTIGTAFVIFAKKVIRERRIPFEITANQATKSDNNEDLLQCESFKGVSKPLCFRIDPELKLKMEQMCEEMGMTLGTALVIFTKKVIHERRIPFEITADSFYSESNLTENDLIKESDVNDSASKTHLQTDL